MMVHVGFMVGYGAIAVLELVDPVMARFNHYLFTCGYFSLTLPSKDKEAGGCIFYAP
jgi:hypothetical protein